MLKSPVGFSADFKLPEPCFPDFASAWRLFARASVYSDVLFCLKILVTGFSPA
jgi:hypothetical protein